MNENWVREEIPTRTGICIKHTHKITGSEIKKWWSIPEDEKIKDAIFYLLTTECGFSTRVTGPAFNADNGCLRHDTILEIRKTEHYPQADTYEILFDGKVIQNHFDPNEALESFLKIKKEKEIGMEFAEINFSSGVVKSGQPRKLVKREPVAIDLNPGQFVFVDGAMGIVIGKSDTPDFVHIWYGNENKVEDVPYWAIKNILDTPPVKCHYWKFGPEIKDKSP